MNSLIEVTFHTAGNQVRDLITMLQKLDPCTKLDEILQTLVFDDNKKLSPVNWKENAAWKDEHYEHLQALHQDLEDEVAKLRGTVDDLEYEKHQLICKIEDLEAELRPEC